ncbi:type II toxin-antitoxin system VapC family toxin [Mucilaginibacter sp. BJC16-A38]|uniref:type II toxin-antitoxin system VapC family toxin n=1 Tax=Mucilaginibacter phenanthrenivorans TaxID=1234842 RepID=UPI0021572C71|nr:type II toxin-antitoxin system VapC family toxin [Mucilaginibacter phenanthrenivorans]MCR8556359.1 type II toxin-antitoxin system VapC family toxin [Mucilaginibacter phenanthrenivorans]
MADKIVLAGTSILIDYFRKTNKPNSAFVKLFEQGYDFCISAITEYEIYSGATPAQFKFWEAFLDNVRVLPFDRSTAKEAVNINAVLKTKSKQIDLADLFIAATAISNDLPCATLNRKHFDRIDSLQVIEL